MPRPLTAVPFARTLGLLLLVLCLGCEGESGAPPPPPAEAPPPVVERAPNMLVIVADDIGAREVGIYGDPHFEGRTPNIDRLGGEGLVFERFWSMPACSSTRAALMTGEYPSRNGIGSVVQKPPEMERRKPGSLWGMPESTFILPRALAKAGYTSAMLGKWHLALWSQALDHAERMGFDLFLGSFSNLGPPDYFGWYKVVGGKLAFTTKYATTDTTDDAIAQANALPEPWLIVVSYNAAHGPAHVPPAGLHGFGEFDPEKQPRLAFGAMIEAMDSEIGRLLTATAAHDPFVVFMGDNGAPGWVPKAGQRKGHGKGSVFEGGVHVPFIVQHSSIVSPGRRVAGLAGVTDVFATLVELAGVELPAERQPRDSASLVPYLRSPEVAPVRSWIYTERFMPNGPVPRRMHERAVRDERYKLVRRDNERGKLFDLSQDPGERRALKKLSPEARAAYRRLEELGALLPPARADSG